MFFILYTTYVSLPVLRPWWQCDNPVTVVKEENILWNPDSQNITVTTNSEAGSGVRVYVQFYDTYFMYTGNVDIFFGTEIKYKIGYCSTTYKPFTAALPAETKKTWTITYTHADKRLVLHCNGVRVADVVISNSACSASDWEDYWEEKPTQMQFYSHDDASDTYCFSSNPGKYNGVIDSGE